MKTEIEILRITNAISYIVCKSPLSYDYNGKRLSRHDKIYIDAVLRVMAGCSDKHKFFLDDLINRLKISDEKFELVYINVSLRMFSDRVIDWAKIITLYLFAARIAQHYHDNGMESIADSVIDMNKQFVEEYIADWIVQQGGWDDFLEKFPSKTSMEDSIRKGLTVLAVVGLGSLAAIAASR